MSYDQWLACLVIWREARGESLSAKTGIWHVIQNRAADLHHRWPKSIAGVIAQRLQFSSMTATGDPNLIQWPSELSHSSDWQAFVDCQIVVLSPLNADPVHGANMYESEPPTAPPYWVKDATLVATIGNIRFYTLN